MAKSPSVAQQGWALFDRIIALRAADGYTNPWRIIDGERAYVPDYEALQRLLGVPLHLNANTQSGVPALALDVWLAYELRRAGFDPDAVWPRAIDPRILPAAVAGLLASLPARGDDRRVVEDRVLKGTRFGVIASKARILGKNYVKQVDVVLSDWSTGPEILISTKRMDSSFGKNAANRVEESYGDAKNLRLRHPQAALGFVFGLRSTIYEKEAAKAEWLIDLLGKLGQEDDAYHAVSLILMDYDEEPPADDGETVNEPETGPTDDGADGDSETSPQGVTDAEADRALARLPDVRILLDRTPDVLLPARFLESIITRVLAATPVDFHTEARARRAAPVVP